MECHNQETMALLWKPDSWSLRLAELEARSPELKEAPLRRDVRSLGMLLGEVLREQAGDSLFEAVEALRRTAIPPREAEDPASDAPDTAAARGHLQQALFSIHAQAEDPTRAYQLARAF